jgi:hypothetical protein
MSVQTFRRLCLSMPEAFEGEHMGHPDFRVKNRIFATLMPHKRGERERWGMVKLTPAQQKKLVAAHPESISPVPGGWGVQGMTRLRLGPASGNVADKATMRSAIIMAWRNTAPKRLLDEAIFAESR